jgi:hypothetical protein
MDTVRPFRRAALAALGAAAVLVAGAVLGAAPAMASTGLKPTSTPNFAGYQISQAHATTFPFRAVEATWKLPKITKVSKGSYAFTYFVVGLGGQDNGILVGVEESMVYGQVAYQAFADLGNDFVPFSAITVKPGDTITADIDGSNADGWNTDVSDNTRGHTEGLDGPFTVTQQAVEVAVFRPGNPIGAGYLPLAATTAVTFTRATYINAKGQTFPLVTLPSGGKVQRLQMRNTAGTKTIAVASQAAKARNAFAVQDGDKTPPAP